MQLTPILEVAKEILKSAGLKGMHVDDIAKLALEQNKNMGLSFEDFSRKLQTALASNLKLKTQKPSFARVEGSKRGQYRRGWYRTKLEKQLPVANSITPPDTEKSYIGKAGEMAVMSELLFWGYNASAMLVDSGIDLVASKSGKYFHIQVKTSTENDGRFYFSIKNSSFLANHDSSMFYVFVLRRKLNCEFIIIPSSYINALISSGKIAQNSALSITISVDEKRHKYILNGSVDIGIYVANFGHIV